MSLFRNPGDSLNESSRVGKLAHRFLIERSKLLTFTLIAFSMVGVFLGTKIALRLSLTDLLPDKHPAVLKLNELTEVVGGVGYFAVVLKAEDGESHLKIAPQLQEEMAKSPLVRNVFYHREQRFFVDRLLYYMDIPKLQDLEKNISSQIRKARRSVIDLGLFDDDEEKKDKDKPVFESNVKEMAQKSANISPYLVTKDKKYLLLMVKPSFDSTDLDKTEALMGFAEGVLKQTLPQNVTYEFAERYYAKIVETNMIKTDIFLLGTLSILAIMGIIFFYLKSFKALFVIFAPVFMGMGITIGITYLVIGHINIITGFLMGIVSGLGVDYGIHLLLRLRLEKEEPSMAAPDPVWRAVASSGHAIFVGAVSAAFAFYLLCFSSFKAFSEFGFICGTGILAVLACLLCTFSFLCRFLHLDGPEKATKLRQIKLPLLPIPKGLAVGLVVTLGLCVLGSKVEFEYDFGKMLQHSKHLEELSNLVDEIYERSAVPSAFAARDKKDAIEVENYMKEKYVPAIVSEIVSGATIVPDDQVQKQAILRKIDEKLAKISDEWVASGLDIPADVVRGWVTAKPFTFNDLPRHLQDALRGTRQEGFLMYFYPAIKLSNAHNVNTYADMIRDIEGKHPKLLTGSDAVVFSDILHLINRDGKLILIAIFVSVGLFIWINVRKWDDTLLSYLPLLLSLPVGMGLMVITGVKFNIFNISIIPTFVAMGIDVPIHIVHRWRETGSGFKAARDLSTSINLALITAGAGFGVLIFARAGVLKSLGQIALLGTLAIWWVGLFLLPAFLEYLSALKSRKTGLQSQEISATS